MSAATIYQRLVDAGCKVEGHESDLYVRWDATAERVLRDHTPRVRFEIFRSPVDRLVWADIPFAFAPYWDAKEAKRADRLGEES